MKVLSMNKPVTALISLAMFLFLSLESGIRNL